jgi:digeranylgeranylglycerophospholipid reductase
VRDAIIIGAGPAGSWTAKKLSDAGLDVLLVDRRQEIGEPVRCGEGLNEDIVERMGIRGMMKDYHRVEIARVIAPNGEFVETKGEGWIIDRKKWDKDLAEMAADAGTEVISRTTALGLKDGKKDEVIFSSYGKRWSERARIIIGADGIESRVGTWFGIKTQLKLDQVMSGFQYEMAGLEIDPNVLLFYIGQDIAPKGYFWVFPKSASKANVGVGIATQSVFTAKEYTDNMVKRLFPKGSKLQSVCGVIPVKHIKEIVKDNCALVGDAARHVNAIHGGGIDEACTGAIILAETIIKNEGLKDYPKKWEDEKGERLKRLEKFAAFYTVLNDDEINTLVSVGAEKKDEILSGDLRVLISIVRKQPSLFRHIRHLF